MKNVVRGVLLTGLMMVLFSSCNLTDKYREEEEEKIQNYLSQHPELTFELKESGLYYMDVNIGTGEQVMIKDTVFVYFKGCFLDGTEFTSNIGKEVYAFPAGEGYVIPGLDEGVLLMREGGNAKLLIPSSLGYGNSGYYMPAYTPLIFDIQLDSIAPGPGIK